MSMDYSFLFSSMNSIGSSNSGSNYLADYASIKNGSYLKLMKKYYAENPPERGQGSSVFSNSTSTDTAKTLSTIKSDAESLQDSAAALTTKGSKSLFKQKEVTKEKEDGTKETVKEYDMDAIYKGVKAFVDDYNSLIDSASEANSTKLLRQTLNLTKATKSYANLLGDVGIKIGKGNKLEIDEEAFKEANITTVKSLFNGNASFAYNVSTKASMLGAAANTEASKANTYNGKGAYNSYSSGNIFDSYF